MRVFVFQKMHLLVLYKVVRQHSKAVDIPQLCALFNSDCNGEKTVEICRVSLSTRRGVHFRPNDRKNQSLYFI